MQNQFSWQKLSNILMLIYKQILFFKERVDIQPLYFLLIMVFE